MNNTVIQVSDARPGTQGPVENLLAHIADPGHVNFFSN